MSATGMRANHASAKCDPAEGKSRGKLVGECLTRAASRCQVEGWQLRITTFRATRVEPRALSRWAESTFLSLDAGSETNFATATRTFAADCRACLADRAAARRCIDITDDPIAAPSPLSYLTFRMHSKPVPIFRVSLSGCTPAAPIFVLMQKPRASYICRLTPRDARLASDRETPASSRRGGAHHGRQRGAHRDRPRARDRRAAPISSTSTASCDR